MPLDDESPSNQVTDASEFETQFVPRSSDDEVLYEVEEITAETTYKYRVKWAGLDPATQKPWPQSWVDKHDCTDALVAEWKAKKAKKKQQQQKDGSYGRTSSRSRSSKSISVAPSSRRTRRSDPSPPKLSEDERPLHTSTSHIQKEQSTKRKRRSSNETHRAVNGKDAAEREEPIRPRKKRKISVEVVIAASPKQGDRSTNKTGNTDRELGSESEGDPSPEDEGVASVPPIKVGPPRGVKPQSSSGRKLKRGGAANDTFTSSSKINHHTAVVQASKKNTSAPGSFTSILQKTFVREPILSPGAVARLELFDRIMAMSPDGDNDDTNAPTRPLNKRPKHTPHKSYRDTPETSQAVDSSTQSPRKIAASKLVKMILPKIDSDEDSSHDDTDGKSESPPHHSSKSHSGTSRIIAKDGSSRRIDNQSKQNTSDLPENVGSPSKKTNHAKSHLRLALKPVPQISPNTFRDKLGLVRPADAIPSEPPPSSIESFASPQIRRPFVGKRLTTRLARKTAPQLVSEDDVEQDDEDRPRESAGDTEEEEEAKKEEEEESGGDNEEARPKERRTDSEVRKRGKELFDEEQRRRDGKRAVVSQLQRLKPLGKVMGRLKSAKERSAVAGPSHKGGVPDDDRLDSVLQEMEDTYVNLSGKTQSSTLETSVPSNTGKKPWTTLTSEEREALRIQLRQEEEEDTQEAIRVPVSQVRDVDSFVYDCVEENAMQVSMDPGPPEQPVQVGSQERSTRTENTRQASVIVQASQGQRQSDAEDVDVAQSLPQLPSSLPREPPSYVSDTPKRRLHEALSILNAKSEEIQRLQIELTQERRNAERAQTELAKSSEDCEALRTSVSEERVRLQGERADLEERRRRWTEDRLTWTEEMERWKVAHNVWKKQREESPLHQQLKHPEQPTGVNGIAKTYSLEENRPILNGGHMAPGTDAWEAERKMLIEARDSLSEKVSQLNASIDQVTAAKESVETDRDFFREQYARASGFVSSVRTENAELEERVKIAEGQAAEGVARIKQLFETNVKALQDDIHRWKTLAEILQEKDSRTNDEVRTRAAQTIELESLCRTLLRNNNSLESDLRKLGRALQRVSVQRNKLSSKVLSVTKEKAKLKAKLAKYSDSQDLSTPTQEHSSIVVLEDGEIADPSIIDATAVLQPTPPHEEASYDDEEWFACLWRHQLELCSRMFDSKEDLLRHMSEHVS
ncbi:hypothetical protein EV401DRAFT_1046290 [Pisolithus croceorrhizus]|nr:hypothetical protein EV401DRAFT_1046290 [Pisolithus croceorrhizus]